MLFSARLQATVGTLTLAATIGCGQDLVDEGQVAGLGIEDQQWELTYADEFDWLDMSKYNTQYIWDRSTIINGEKQFYVDPQQHGHNPFSVENGKLRITAQRTPDHVKWATGQPYVSGVLTSRQKFEQKYGRFEIRAKLPKGRGLWPAFWMLPTHDQWPSGVQMLAELDVMEFIGHEGSWYHTTRHSNEAGDRAQDGKAINTNANLTDEFHNYAVVWDESKIRWYFDGQEVFSSDTPSDFHHPKHFLLNLAVGGWWPGDPDGNTSFPARFEVDYVRVYKRSGQGGASNPSNPTPSGQQLDPVHGQWGQTYSNTSGELFWKPGSNNDDNTRYDIYRNGDYQDTVSGGSYFAQNLSPGTSYQFEVQATADGYSPSNRVSISLTTDGDSNGSGEEPNLGSATGIVAPTNLRGTVYAARSLEVFWDASPTQGIEYELWRGDLHMGNFDGLSFYDGDVEPNRSYTYVVYARLQNGQRSEASNMWQVTTPGE